MKKAVFQVLTRPDQYGYQKFFVTKHILGCFESITTDLISANVDYYVMKFEQDGYTVEVIDKFSD